MKSQRIRIRLKAFDHRLIDLSTQEIVNRESPSVRRIQAGAFVSVAIVSIGCDHVVKQIATHALAGLAPQTRRD